MKKLIALLLITCLFILIICVPIYANTNLTYYLSLQPTNVRNNLVKQNTNIYVVDVLPWEDPNLATTWAYTTMNVENMQVQSIDIFIKTGYESALIHEIGHCISNYNNIPYGWCYTPEFQRIWQLERRNCVLLIGQGLTDIREYFAEAYNLYINYRQILKESCPMTYNYITMVLKYTS